MLKILTYLQMLNVLLIPINTIDECSQKVITLNGVSSTSAYSIFNAIADQYNDERAQYGRTVDLNVSMPKDNTLLKVGLAGTIVPTSEPVVFLAINSQGASNENELRFPMVASATIIIYNLPGYDNLTLSMVTITNIYLGITNNWNATYNSMNYNNVTMPNVSILPIARSDADGSTGLFTQVLSANNADWNKTYGTFFGPYVNNVCCNSSWPPNSTYMLANNVVGMVGVVVSIPYTIGYATLPSIADFVGAVPRARLIMSQKQPILVEPTKQNVQAAIDYFLSNSDPKSLTVNVKMAGAAENMYPMSAITHFAVNKSYVNIDCCVIQELVGFLDWFFFDEGDAILEKILFVPVTDGYKSKTRKLVLEEITCNGEKMYPKYLQSKVLLTMESEMPSWETALISVVVCISAVVCGCTAFYCIYVKKLETGEARWFVDEKYVKHMPNKRSEHDSSSLRETISIHSASFLGSADDKSLKAASGSVRFNHRSAVTALKELMDTGETSVEGKIFLDKLESRFPQHWAKATKRIIYKLKNLNNKNVANLIGVTVIKNEVYVLLEYCSKGTLHYVLNTSKYNITENIKYQFAIDVAQGMKFLHQNGLINGRLSSLTCCLDSSWTVKLVQHEQMTIYTIENPKAVYEFGTYYADKYMEEYDLIHLLYVDPQIRQAFNENADVYSFGMLLVEIFARKLPYFQELEEGSTTYGELLKKKFFRNFNVSPKMTKFPRKVQNLVNDCITVEKHRPTFNNIYTDLKTMTKISTGIVDIIMNALEQHADKLEEKVEERTLELKQMTSKMRVLLHEVLPPQIADKLFAGEAVPPEYFECVTVYFSDIVGFTTISAKSTPIEVMGFLNDLWMAFDAVIDKFDVYKVDTIGDAYMVCSGLPTRNGTSHCKSIAMLALALLGKCAEFKIKHLPDEILKIRIGVNSGPVTAGVVGSKMPQYCVFGDTVNTAARMESTSEPQKIQLSPVSYDLISAHFPNMFDTQYRGETNVKGKGTMKTYWLNGLKKKL